MELGEIAKWTGVGGLVVVGLLYFGRKFIAAQFLQQLTKEQSYNVIRLFLWIFLAISITALLVYLGIHIAPLFKQDNPPPAKVAEAIIEKIKITKDNLDVANYVAFYNHDKIDSSRTPCIQLKLTNTGEKPAFITHIDLIVDRVVSLKKPGPQVEAVVPDSRKYKITIEPKPGIYTVQTENGITKEKPFDRFLIQFMEKEEWTTSGTLYFCKLCIHVNGDGGTFYSRPFAFAIGIHHGLVPLEYLQNLAETLYGKNKESYVKSELDRFESFAALRTENNETIAKEINNQPPPLLLSDEITKIVTPFGDPSLDLPNPKPVLEFKFQRYYIGYHVFVQSVGGEIIDEGKTTYVFESKVTPDLRFIGVGRANQSSSPFFPEIRKTKDQKLELPFVREINGKSLPQFDVRLFSYHPPAGKFALISETILLAIIDRSIQKRFGHPTCLTTKESDEIEKHLNKIFNIKNSPDSHKRVPLRMDDEEPIHQDYVENKK